MSEGRPKVAERMEVNGGSSPDTTTGPRVPKIIDRLNAAKKACKFYESHQLYKTLFFRCMTRRQYQEAANHMLTGATFLLENKQTESGFDLANMYIKIHRDNHIALTSSTVADLRLMYKLMRPGCRERVDFVVYATDLLKSASKTSDAVESQKLYKMLSLAIGKVLWQELNYEEARYHLIRSDDGFSTGCMLVDFHMRSGFRSEVDLFIAQAVLQLLCMQKLAIGALVFHTYTRKHPNLEPGPPFTSYPLLNFVWFLMMAVQSKSEMAVFTLLVDRYQVSLSRDPEYPNYLERIGQLYFGMPKAKNVPGGPSSLMNDLLQMFTSGANTGSPLDEAGTSGSEIACSPISMPQPEDMD